MTQARPQILDLERDTRASTSAHDAIDTAISNAQPFEIEARIYRDNST